MLRVKGRVACMVVASERPGARPEPSETLQLFPLMVRSTQVFAVLSAVLYAYGFLAVRSRLGAIGARHGLSVADPRYLVEGTRLLLTIVELLFPYAFVCSCVVALIRASIAIRSVWRLLRNERAFGSLRSVGKLACVRRLVSSMVVVVLMRASQVAPLSIGTDARDSERLMWALLNGKVQSECLGSCRFELVLVVFVASSIALFVLPRSDWISCIGWLAIAFQAMFVPIAYSQLIRVPVPVVTIDRGPRDASKPFTAFLLWSSDSEYLFHDGHETLHVPANSIGPIRVRCTVLGKGIPTEEPRCEPNKQTAE